MSDALHCPNCGASLIQKETRSAPPSAPQVQYQPQPPQGPPQQQYQAQPLKKRQVTTVNNVGLTEMLFLVSGIFLILAGFGNLSALSDGMPPQYPILGIIALLAGLLILAMLVMPNLLKGLNNIMGLLLIGISALFFIWGLAALFLSGVGWYGAELVAAGFAGLVGSALKMGFIK